MNLTCEATKLDLAVLTHDTQEAARELRRLVERHLPIDNPSSRRRMLVRLLGLILDEPHRVDVEHCEWNGAVDDLIEGQWSFTGRRHITWVCPRCGTTHEHEIED